MKSLKSIYSEKTQANEGYNLKIVELLSKIIITLLTTQVMLKLLYFNPSRIRCNQYELQISTLIRSELDICNAYLKKQEKWEHLSNVSDDNNYLII